MNDWRATAGHEHESVPALLSISTAKLSAAKSNFLQIRCEHVISTVRKAFALSSVGLVEH